MIFTYGNTSNRRLDTAHKDLQLIFRTMIKRTKIDVGIAEGHRSVLKQQMLYSIGRTTELHRKRVTNIDGITKLGKHNYKPSQAVDFYIWHNDKNTRSKIAYDGIHLAYVVGLLDSITQELYDAGEITHLLRWGGNWDNDGIIIYDQNFDDLPHVELIKQNK